MKEFKGFKSAVHSTAKIKAAVQEHETNIKTVEEGLHRDSNQLLSTRWNQDGHQGLMVSTDFYKWFWITEPDLHDVTSECFRVSSGLLSVSTSLPAAAERRSGLP